MQVIFSSEDTMYMWWQAELLHYTFERASMPAELTGLVADASEAHQNTFTCDILRVSNYKDRCANGPLLVLNKPGGITEWAALSPSSRETVLIVDPDSIFLRAVEDLGPIPDGEAFSEEHDYMGLQYEANKLVIDRHCKPLARSRIQPVGIYIMINRYTLVDLARLWLQKSIEIASDAVCRRALGGTGWLSDMWGYAIAAAELGIHHRLRGFSQVTGSNSLDHPITHYCFPLMINAAERWHPETQSPILWSKWRYVPWSWPPDPDDSTAEGRDLLQRLRELVHQQALQAMP